jgi:hypothetical protein
VLTLHPTSVLNAVFPEWVLYSEIVKTGSQQEYFIKDVSEIDVGWLTEIASHFYQDVRQEI